MHFCQKIYVPYVAPYVFMFCKYMNICNSLRLYVLYVARAREREFLLAHLH